MTQNWSGGHLNDGAWWWGTASEGIIGGVVGGLFTALAVVMTIRHERTSQTRAVAAEAASALLITTLSMSSKVKADSMSESEALQEILARALDLGAKFSGHWPSATVLLQQRVDSLIEVWSSAAVEGTPFEQPAVTKALANVSGVANDWMFDRPRRDGWRKRRAAVRDARQWFVG